jgi:RNA polymerase sigma factor (sigma-70 family)
MKMNSELNGFDLLVEQHYESLYRFALSLSNNPSDAGDLTQQAFYVAQTKGHQLRDASKVRTWLSTTLHRLFLQRRRHETRFPKYEISEVEQELPRVNTNLEFHLDAKAVTKAVNALADRFRVPLTLYYFEDLTYKEIASSLKMPIGTIMSRIARAKSLLRNRFDTGNGPRPLKRHESPKVQLPTNSDALVFSA